MTACFLKQDHFRDNRGFSIIELLMVLAVIGLAVGLFVVNIDNAIEGITRQSPAEVMLQSFRKARLLAVTEKKPVFLTYNRETDAFELRAEWEIAAAPVAIYPLDETDKPLIQNVRFWPIEPMRMQTTRRYYETFEHGKLAWPSIRFEPTGLSHFVAVELVYAPEVADPVWMLMDPFSSGVLEGEVR